MWHPEENDGWQLNWKSGRNAIKYHAATCSLFPLFFLLPSVNPFWSSFKTSKMTLDGQVNTYFLDHVCELTAVCVRLCKSHRSFSGVSAQSLSHWLLCWLILLTKVFSAHLAAISFSCIIYSGWPLTDGNHISLTDLTGSHKRLMLTKM